MSSQKDRNHLLNNLSQEGSSFLWENIKLAEHTFQNYESPLPKSFGRKLNRLIKLQCELESLEKQKECIQRMIQVAVVTNNQKEKEKLQKQWTKTHDKQLKQAGNYLEIKKTWK